MAGEGGAFIRSGRVWRFILGFIHQLFGAGVVFGQEYMGVGGCTSALVAELLVVDRQSPPVGSPLIPVSQGCARRWQSSPAIWVRLPLVVAVFLHGATRVQFQGWVWVGKWDGFFGGLLSFLRRLWGLWPHWRQSQPRYTRFACMRCLHLMLPLALWSVVGMGP